MRTEFQLSRKLLNRISTQQLWVELCENGKCHLNFYFVNFAVLKWRARPHWKWETNCLFRWRNKYIDNFRNNGKKRTLQHSVTRRHQVEMCVRAILWDGTWLLPRLVINMLCLFWVTFRWLNVFQIKTRYFAQKFQFISRFEHHQRHHRHQLQATMPILNISVSMDERHGNMNKKKEAEEDKKKNCCHQHICSKLAFSSYAQFAVHSSSGSIPKNIINHFRSFSLLFIFFDFSIRKILCAFFFFVARRRRYSPFRS